MWGPQWDPALPLHYQNLSRTSSMGWGGLNQEEHREMLTYHWGTLLFQENSVKVFCFFITRLKNSLYSVITPHSASQKSNLGSPFKSAFQTPFIKVYTTQVLFKMLFVVVFTKCLSSMIYISKLSSNFSSKVWFWDQGLDLHVLSRYLSSEFSQTCPQVLISHTHAQVYLKCF